MSLALGLGAGLGAAYLLERLDNKVRSAEQLEVASGLPTLGVIPNVTNVEEQVADVRSALNEASGHFVQRCSSRRSRACPAL